MPPKKRKIDRLVGPIHLSILDGPHGERVVILGDEHVHKPVCPPKTSNTMPITVYLSQLFKHYTSDIPLDFFLEIDFPQKARRTKIQKLERGPANIRQSMANRIERGYIKKS